MRKVAGLERLVWDAVRVERIERAGDAIDAIRDHVAVLEHRVDAFGGLLVELHQTREHFGRGAVMAAGEQFGACKVLGDVGCWRCCGGDGQRRGGCKGGEGGDKGAAFHVGHVGLLRMVCKWGR